jgi:hypothetical protein
MVVEIWNNMKKYVEDQKGSIFVNIAPNNLKTGIRGGSCNPSYWEVGIWGWFGVGW